MLTFEEKRHKYFWDGQPVVSVTQALSIVDERWKDPFYLLRGSYVHRATELYDRDELDESSIDPQILPYLNSYRMFLQETDFRPRWIESQHFHPQHKYAGTIDRMGSLNGNQVLIDLKSGGPARVDDLQVAAYWELTRNDVLIKKCFTLHLRDDGGMPKLREVEKPRLLLPVFLSCLQAYRWREGI